MKKVCLGLMVLMMSVAVQANLRAYWAFEEGSGDYAFDSSGNGNTGLLVADTQAGDPATPLGPTTQPDWIAGVRGTGALQFCAGTDNYNSVWVAKSDSIKDLQGYWSFSMWVRQDSQAYTPGGGGGYPRVISCPNYEIELDNGDGWGDYFWPYGTPAFQVDLGTNYIEGGGNLGEWYHMAVVYDGTNLMKYINGTLVPDSVTNLPGLGISNIWDDSGWTDSVLKLACQTWPNKDWLRGALDDVAIWGNQSLTSEQVMGLYTGELTPLDIPEPASLVLLALGGLLLRKKN